MKQSCNVLGKLNCRTRTFAVFVLCATTVIALPGQTFTTLFSFAGGDGGAPRAALVQATNGDLYGTSGWGAHGDGTVFKITPSGTLTTLYNFCAQSGCAGGAFPTSGLVQAAHGDFYGTTGQGGANGRGTVFKITPGGTLTTLYSFCSQSNCTDGAFPYAGLVQGVDGDFYGTTGEGGAYGVPYGYGTVFKITPAGTLTTLYSFCAQTNCTDGESPNGLVQAAHGDFYGTTTYGGGNISEGVSSGTVFKITPSGTLTTLYSFCSQGGQRCTDGAVPVAGLVQATNGDFYGTTHGGGTSRYDGTVFKIAPGGTLTTLYSFCSQSGCADGQNPGAALVQATDGDFYGTTESGGTNLYYGTIFKITPGGMLTTLYSFCSQNACVDGGTPYAGLVQATNGDFYGTTASEGTDVHYGTAFSLSMGLGPFVKTLPTSGKVGATVKILGSDLTGATGVSFNGTAAVFEVVSNSEITATVPAGAIAGRVQVATPGGTLSSNVPFRVLP